MIEYDVIGSWLLAPGSWLLSPEQAQAGSPMLNFGIIDLCYVWLITVAMLVKIQNGVHSNALNNQVIGNRTVNTTLNQWLYGQTR